MDLEDKLLMMPGPVPVAPRILRAMSKPMINHRSPAFSQIYDDCINNLKSIFYTDDDIFILSGSGTAAMEAAIGCTIEKDDTIIAVENGKFGERFKDIASRYGKVAHVEYGWGSSVDIDQIKEKLEQGAKAIAMVHNETSTGILNPAKEVGKLAKEYGALFIMDGVTSIGGDDVFIDDWNVDIAVVGSQKCIGAPPGLSMISVSEKAFDVMENVKSSPYYLDLKAYKKSADKELTQTPYTPALPLFYGLQEALNIIMEESMELRIKRHQLFSRAVREAMNALGIEMFPTLNDHSNYSNTVSAMKVPDGINGNDIKKDMLNEGIIIAGGQSHLSGKIFRIGNMGNVNSNNVLSTIQTLEMVLKNRKQINTLGDGVQAASDVLNTVK